MDLRLERIPCIFDVRNRRRKFVLLEVRILIAFLHVFPLQFHLQTKSRSLGEIAAYGDQHLPVSHVFVLVVRPGHRQDPQHPAVSRCLNGDSFIPFGDFILDYAFNQARINKIR